MHQKLILLREKKNYPMTIYPRGILYPRYKYKFSHMPLILKKEKENPHYY